MLLMLLYVIICALFVYIVRKKRRVLSYILTVELAVIVLLFVIMGLSAFSLQFFTAFNRKIDLFGINVSSMMLFTLALFLMTFFIMFYAALFIVKKLKQYTKEIRQYCRDNYASNETKQFVYNNRKIYLINCRMND